MSKLLLSTFCLSMLISTGAYAQEKTGVDTTMPTESLDINGTTRIRDLPENGTGTIYNGSDLKNTTFNATHTIVSDAAGNLGSIDGTPASEPLRVENTTTEATVNTQNVYQNGRVGIGDFSTQAIGNALHVKAVQDPIRLEGLQESTDAADMVLVVDQDGVVKIDVSSSTQIVAFMSNDQSTYGQDMQKINVDDVLVNAGGEFDAINSEFTPLETGVYRIDMTVTTRGYGANGSYPDNNGFENERAVLGLAEQVAGGTDTWVSRFSYNPTRDQRTISFIGSAELIAGKSYYFAVYGAQAYPGVELFANPTGTSGSGKGSYFEISKID